LIEDDSRWLWLVVVAVDAARPNAQLLVRILDHDERRLEGIDSSCIILDHAKPGGSQFGLELE
jgi:hypothetical protein